MFEHLSVTRFGLVLNEEVIGYRYVIYFGRDMQYTWDMDKSIITTLEYGLSRNGVVIKIGKPIVGFMVGDVFKTRSEWGVVEIESVDALKKAIKGMTDRYQKFLQLYDKIDVYFAKLKTELRNAGAAGWVESRDNYDNLTWECRFLGGFGAWSGGGQDICDANVLDRKVSKLVNTAIGIVRKYIGSDYELNWQTGEKAWCYFTFSLKE